MAGEFDEAKGRVKEAAGDLADDPDLKAEGKTDKAAGRLKDKVEDVKDKVTDVIDNVRDRRTAPTGAEPSPVLPAPPAPMVRPWCGGRRRVWRSTRQVIRTASSVGR